MGETNLTFRRLDSLTPDEYQVLDSVLKLLGVDFLRDKDSSEYVMIETIYDPQIGQRRTEALRVPTSESVDELIRWARLLNGRSSR